ncbi:hypothetical protein [Microvirga sp. VF16]|uniref:hypothetical protein n=1 Tax=Microvirga sp. VF16 TaxID=2807101 RepID=UPI00193C9CE1|nr:hypothetical protein [Microvirga sp. VF16]QRM28596.1 hypothetical protein JO965_20550 [Microvirga sp. VF16]
MKQIYAFFLMLAITVIGASPAFAHRPYFTQVEKIRLPGGEMGEARLLNGDGILGPDPVRVVLVDGQGRLLARSHKSRSMALACREEGQCLIFDFSTGKILDPDPSSFQRGPIVPSLSDDEREGLWGLEDGSEDWGFTDRDPSFGEMVLGYRIIVSSKLPEIIVNAITGALCALLAAAAFIIARQIRTRYFETFMAAFAILLIFGMGLFLTLISGFFSLMGGLTLGPWLASLCLGGGLFGVGVLIRKRSQTQAAPE